MAIEKGTLITVSDNSTVYVFPRTSADIVQYEEEISVKDKIEDILQRISELDAKKIITVSADDVVNSNMGIYELNNVNIDKINLNINTVENITGTEITLETIYV